MLASRLEDDSMSYGVFSPILYYANLAPASGEDLLEMAQSFRSTEHEHLMLQSITYCSPQPLAGSQRSPSHATTSLNHSLRGGGLSVGEKAGDRSLLMSQPSIYDRCFGIDFAHYNNLAVAFGQVLLVDADGVYPVG